MGVVDIHVSSLLNDMVNAKVLDSAMLSEVAKSLGVGDAGMETPIWEVVLFLVLSAITFYRKELSSNRVHREHKSQPPLSVLSNHHHYQQAAATAVPDHESEETFGIDPAAMMNLDDSASNPVAATATINNHHPTSLEGDKALLFGALHLEGFIAEHIDPLALAGELKHRAGELIDPLKNLPTRLLPLLPHIVAKAMGNNPITSLGPIHANKDNNDTNFFIECPLDVSRHVS